MGLGLEIPRGAGPSPGKGAGEKVPAEQQLKEMILGRRCKQDMSPVMISGQVVEQVTSFKLLGVTVTDSLRWNDHIDAITAKASKRLWFLKNSNELVYHSLISPTTMKQLLDLS